MSCSKRRRAARWRKHGASARRPSSRPSANWPGATRNTRSTTTRSAPFPRSSTTNSPASSGAPNPTPSAGPARSEMIPNTRHPTRMLGVFADQHKLSKNLPLNIPTAYPQPAEKQPAGGKTCGPLWNRVLLYFTPACLSVLFGLVLRRRSEGRRCRPGRSGLRRLRRRGILRGCRRNSCRRWAPSIQAGWGRWKC